MAKTIRLSINDDVESLLQELKRQYPALDYPEILKLALSELYRKQELEARNNWAAALPELPLTDYERARLDNALNEADDEIRREQARVLSVKDIMAEATKD